MCVADACEQRIEVGRRAGQLMRRFVQSVDHGMIGALEEIRHADVPFTW
jgi:hypothetical protein